MADSVIEPWQMEDALGSYHEAIAIIGERVKSGEDLPDIPYFQNRQCDCKRCKERRK